MFSRIFRKILRNSVTDWIWMERHLIVYRMDRNKAQSLLVDSAFKINSEEDIFCFQQTECWLSRDSFIAEARRRISNGIRIYTITSNDILLHYGWLVPHQERAWFPYVQQYFDFPPKTAVLFNFYTHPAARGRGLYQRAMARMAHDAARIENAEHVFIAVESHNHRSRHAVEKVGFQSVAIPYLRQRFGRTTKNVLIPSAYFG
jgi:RimJ/RimL family protein N-acetyltransferase